mmetsp:Transcript_27703/g.63219  ORF Transcript_27703/g.63219 Transcript_27703/m.63219 type:complete len:206 (+) Transcript_27703:744-1361(+)
MSRFSPSRDQSEPPPSRNRISRSAVDAVLSGDTHTDPRARTAATLAFRLPSCSTALRTTPRTSFSSSPPRPMTEAPGVLSAEGAASPHRLRIRSADVRTAASASSMAISAAAAAPECPETCMLPNADSAARRRCSLPAVSFTPAAAFSAFSSRSRHPPAAYCTAFEPPTRMSSEGCMPPPILSPIRFLIGDPGYARVTVDNFIPA